MEKCAYRLQKTKGKFLMIKIISKLLNKNCFAHTHYLKWFQLHQILFRPKCFIKDINLSAAYS